MVAAGKLRTWTVYADSIAIFAYLVPFLGLGDAFRLYMLQRKRLKDFLFSLKAARSTLGNM